MKVTRLDNSSVATERTSRGRERKNKSVSTARLLADTLGSEVQRQTGERFERQWSRVEEQIGLTLSMLFLFL